jgi:hypothetical protein
MGRITLRRAGISTTFPHKNGYSTVLPGFSTQFFCRKSTFSRFFCKFSAKDVENWVETVENCLIFQQKKLLHNTIAHKVKSICTFV